MTEKEKALKVASLEKLLREEYGIESRVQFLEAYKKLQPIDIAVFVVPVSRPPDGV